MVNFKEIYFEYLEKFKDKIKSEYIEKIFHKEKEKRIELKRIHTKNNQEPEALTSDIIREMLRECKIDPLDISREIVIEGMSNNVFKRVKKKPDFVNFSVWIQIIQ